LLDGDDAVHFFNGEDEEVPGLYKRTKAVAPKTGTRSNTTFYFLDLAPNIIGLPVSVPTNGIWDRKPMTWEDAAWKLRPGLSVELAMKIVKKLDPKTARILDRCSPPAPANNSKYSDPKSDYSKLYGGGVPRMTLIC
jgi:hypothetical protein